MSSRCTYPAVLEHSIYVRPDQQGRGIGRVLLLDVYVAAIEAVGGGHCGADGLAAQRG